MSARLSTNALDLSKEERELLKHALAFQWRTQCRWAQHAVMFEHPGSAEAYRKRADEFMSLSIKLGLGMLS